VTVLTGTATAGSKIITGLSSTTGILNHFFAYDPTFAKLDIDSKVATVDSSTQVTLDRNALASGSVSIQFIQSAPTIFTTGDVVSGSNTISNIPDTSALATNMWVSSVSANSTNKGGYFPWPSVITVVDAHTVTTQGGSNHAGTATGTGVQLMFARQTPGIEAYGTWPVVVPSTYSNHGYTPLAASSGSAIMYRLEPMMEYIADQEFYFVPTTDGNPASTYAPGQDATGQGVRTPRKTSNLTMDGSTNGFSCTSGSDVITITDPTHGASAGDWVNLPFQVSVCGVLLHDWYPIQTVIDANNYTIKSYGAEWYNFEVGSQITATSNVTKGGVVPTFTTFNGMKSVAVTLPNHVQHPSHFDSFSILGSNFTVGGVTIQGNKTPGTTRNEAGNYIAFSANIASNTFTDVIPIVGTGTNRDIHVTITGTFVATITLQSSTDGTTWSDATTWTVPVSTTFNDGLSSNLFYRIGVKTGDFTSRFGTATAAFFSPNEFGINPQFEWSGGTATSTATVAINSGQAQLKYQPVGTTPWPAGKLPNELYVRWYMMLGSDFIPPDNASCTGGKWTMGTAHRTSVSSNGGACACTRASLKGENHYAAMNGWSARNQDNMGVTPGGPDYQKFMLGTYQYGYDFCQDDFMYGILAALNPGQWYSIEIHTKMNTYDTTGLSAPGSAPHDGMIEAWIDGRKTFSKTDFKWREQPPYDPMVGSSSLLQVIGDLGIKSVWNPSYFGGVCAIAFESAYFVKNVAIGTSYIGPMKM
jgi:hypothetical protein